MNKRILMSSLSIFASAALVAGATFAFFSDEETSAGNTFAAGTLDLTIGEPTTIEVTAAPGDEGRVETYTLTNDGTIDGLADLHIMNVVTAGVSTTEPECLAEGGAWNGTDCTGNIPINTIDTQIWVNIGYDLDGSDDVEDDEYLIWHDNNTNQAIDSGDTFEWGNNTNDNNVVATLAQLNSKSFDLGYLPAGADRDLELSFHLDETTGNEYQTDEATFDIEFTLHQDNDTGNTNIVPSGIPTPTPTPS